MTDTVYKPHTGPMYIKDNHTGELWLVQVKDGIADPDSAVKVEEEHE